jgi:hypothetical protein
MVTRSFSSRILALTAAYALALHTLLAGMAPAAHLSGDASLANTVICTGAPGTDQPTGQDQEDRSACVLRCLVAGCAMDAWTPVPSGIVAFLAPIEIRISPLQPIRALNRDTTKNPQNPRAPPAA